MVLHQGANVLINSIDIGIVEQTLQIINNIEVLACSTVIIPTRKSGKWISKTSSIHEVQINEILKTHYPELLCY